MLLECLEELETDILEVKKEWQTTLEDTACTFEKAMRKIDCADIQEDLNKARKTLDRPPDDVAESFPDLLVGVTLWHDLETHVKC